MTEGSNLTAGSGAPLPDRTDQETLPTLSRLGLGAWAFGGVGWGPQDDADSIATIRHAVSSGVGWIDTAAVYGNGHAERIVGAAIAPLPEDERPLVFTKAGVLVDPDTGKTYRDLGPASLRAECEDSMERLGIERIDLYQLHWPVEDPEAVETAWATLGELREEGKIRWAGVSNFGTDLLERCARIRPLDAAQLPLSLLEDRPATAELPWLAAHQVPAIVYSPLESGLLSGRFSLERLAALPEDDWRRRRPRFQSPEVERALRLVERLRPLAAELGASVAELAIAWAFHHDAVAGAIVGARTPAQVDGWIGAAGLDLEPAVLARIGALRTEAGL
ncbi:MAG TPA: aldo/keto reductase [Solirubrobacterales bacterium]|jgi:aryl-alcohol dehydrogenase-like predicted oxidoreductase|nr:aldo/keto reductase [Solirubrobacterales bacterium]